jgi:hypothetical protein
MSAAQPDEVAPGSITPGGPTYRIPLSTVTSYVIVSQRKRAMHVGTVAELEAAYRKAQRHTLLFGWWGFPFGLGWTPLVLHRNKKAFNSLLDLVAAADS